MPSKASKPGATNRPGEARAKVEAFGLEALCSSIADGDNLTDIAEKLIGVSIGTLLVRIESDPEWAARVREARALTSRLWDQKALDVLAAAPDPFGLAKAREMAHHYRWRATKIAPRDYGDKVDIAHTGEITLDDAQLDARIAAHGAALAAAISEATSAGPAEPAGGEAPAPGRATST